MKIFEPHKGKIVYGVTRAENGSFNDETEGFEERLKWLMKEHKIRRPVYAKQIHSDIILNLEEAPKERPEADAFITSEKNLPLMIKVADCQGILIYDPVQNVVGAVHSGWRGSVQNILGKTIAKMEKNHECRPKDLLLFISPSIGPCCMDFSDADGNKVDFWEMTLDQCREAGVKSGNIEIARVCTCCDENYFSHRRNGNPGRMAVFISLK